MRPTSAQLQQIKLFYRLQSAKHGSGVVNMAHGKFTFVPAANLHTLPADRQQIERLITYADSRNDESFVLVADQEAMIATSNTNNHNYTN